MVNARFMMIGRSRFVHVVHTKAYDMKKSECPYVRKAWTAGSFKPGDKGISAEAAMALEGCPRCGTDVLAQSMQSPEAKAADRREQRDDVMARAKGDKPKAKAKTPATRIRSKGVVDPAPTKEPSKTKSGLRSVGNDTDAKAKALAMFCDGSGWPATITMDDDTGHTVVTAAKGDATIHAYFIDGKYDVARHATITVGAWSGTLRGAHAVRRQVDKDLDNRDRPHPEPGRGRSAPRKKVVTTEEDEVVEDESPEDAKRRVPFNLDDPDIEIIDAIIGKRIKWRNGTGGNVEEAWLPTKVRPKGAKRDTIKIVDHPKTGRRILTFLTLEKVTERGDTYGTERSVALDRIIRVKD